MKRIGHSSISSWISIAAVSVVAFAAACSDAPSAVPVEPKMQPTVQDELVAQLIKEGYRRDMIVDDGDQFIVEGDIAISKKIVREHILSGSALCGSGRFPRTSMQAWDSSRITDKISAQVCVPDV